MPRQSFALDLVRCRFVKQDWMMAITRYSSRLQIGSIM